MKKIVLISILSLLLNCERDDICAEATPTTPNALVEFYDVGNPETLKSVTGLYIIGDGVDTPIPDANNVASSSIRIPLRTDQESNTFFFYSDIEFDDDGNIIAGNMDTVVFSYETVEQYVSRACGFKTIFTGFSIDVVDDGDNWIQTTLFVADNQTIENENQAHIHFRH